MAQTYSIEFKEEACKRVQSGVPAHIDTLNERILSCSLFLLSFSYFFTRSGWQKRLFCLCKACAVFI